MAKKYKPSQKVKAAAAAAAALEQSRPVYESTYDSRLQAAMERILNREDFSYDMNADVLYRQYRDSALRSGQLASLEAMGQAAALTGGYGSSYVGTAQQQAYSRQLEGLADKLPQLYALAREQYDRRGDEMQTQYSLLQAAQQRDYSRYRDAADDWADSYKRANDRYAQLRDQEYKQYRDRTADSFRRSELKLKKQNLKERKRQFDAKNGG